VSYSEKEEVGTLEDRVSSILFNEWDPIEVNDDPSAPSDEYASYSAGAIALAATHPDHPMVLADSLYSIADMKMECPVSQAVCLSVAKKIVEEVKSFQT